MSRSDTPTRVTTNIAYTMLVTVMILWASGLVVSRSVHELVNPVGFSFWRWFAATVLLTPFLGAEMVRERVYLRSRFRYFALLGMFIAGASTLFMWAVQYTTATNIALVTATQPIVTGILAWVLLKDRLAPLQLVGVAAATIGIVVMVARMDLGVILTLAFNPGDLVVVIAVVFYSLYTINLHRWITGITPFLIIYMTCLGGMIILIPAYLIELLWVEPMPPDWRVIGAILYMALIPNIVATTMWNTSVGKVGANHATIFMNLLPIFGTLMAVVFLDEQLHSYHLVGGVLVCAGITLVVRTLPADELEIRE